MSSFIHTLLIIQLQEEPINFELAFPESRDHHPSGRYWSKSKFKNDDQCHIGNFDLVKTTNRSKGYKTLLPAACIIQSSEKFEEITNNLFIVGIIEINSNFSLPRNMGNLVCICFNLVSVQILKFIRYSWTDINCEMYW